MAATAVVRKTATWNKDGKGVGLWNRRQADCDREQTTLLLDVDLDQAPGGGGDVREVHVCCLDEQRRRAGRHWGY